MKRGFRIKVHPVKPIDAYPEFSVWPKESGIPPQYTLRLVFECVATTLGTVKPSDSVEELGSYLDAKESLLRSGKVASFMGLLKKRATPCL